MVPRVGGSNPLSHPSFINGLAWFFINRARSLFFLGKIKFLVLNAVLDRNYVLAFRWQNFLNTNVIHQVFPTYINKMQPFLFIRYVRAKAIIHGHCQRSISKVQPIVTADKFSITISGKWVVMCICYRLIITAWRWMFSLDDHKVTMDAIAGEFVE